MFSVIDKMTKPLYKATARSGKHTDPVWQVGFVGQNRSCMYNFVNFRTWLFSAHVVKSLSS